MATGLLRVQFQALKQPWALIFRRALATEVKPKLGEAEEAGLLSSVQEREPAPVIKPAALVHQEKTHKIPHSPQKMNMLAKLIRGLSVDEAMKQMMFSPKRHAIKIYEMLKRGSFSAANKGMDRSKLYVHEAFVNKGEFIKRMEFKARGRTGVRHHPRSSVIIKLKERQPRDKIAEKVERITRRTLKIQKVY